MPFLFDQTNKENQCKNQAQTSPNDQILENATCSQSQNACQSISNDTEIAASHLTRLNNLLSQASKGRYGKDTSILFRETARNPVGSIMPAKSLELKHTIKLIQELTTEIDEIEAAITRIMDEEIQSPILTILCISYQLSAMIIAEIGDFSRFDSAEKILAYAGMSPSTYQSGQLNNCHSHMDKRGSKYLRYASLQRHKICLQLG